ncbi:MAG: ribonuclease [Kiritimatiellae bacterium]|nr:ribonuclease [Kiritimatiellia bacterium]
MKATFKRLLSLGLLFAGMAGLVTSVAASGRTTYPPPARPGGVTHTPPASTRQTPAVHEGGVYYSRDQVAQYIRTFGHLPTNFITKAQARALGWTGGPLERYAPGKSIGGDRFGNYEGRLPRGSYRECDIDTFRRPRGAKRIIYTPQRQIYYTDDHYQTFRKLD